jgi:hypothetical protein
MDSLFEIFVIQVIIWLLLFVFILYTVKKNTLLKKELKLLKDSGVRKNNPRKEG